MSSTKHYISPLKNNLSVKKPKLEVLQAKNDEEIVSNINYELYFSDDDNFDLETLDLGKNELNVLDLSKWCRCFVKNVERHKKTFDLILSVKSESNATSTCYLQGPWAHTRVAEGDVVSIKGLWDDKLNAYKVDKDQGFCVAHADLLISSTTVVGSLFCKRKAVLQEYFRGVDGNSKVMVIGTLVHELLQNVLKEQLKTEKDIKQAAENLLKSEEVTYALYENNLKRAEIETEVQDFIPHILTFVQQFLLGQKVPKPDNFQGTLAEIKDIEENVWVPQLGLKGKIDVSVRINRSKRSKIKPTYNKVLPLELKTGRATFSMEHKGQILLYQMMLTTIGRETNSGLLLYLREGIMRELFGQRNEQRDLIMLRNELAYYLAQKKKNIFDETECKQTQPFELPEPISHPTACSNCPYATICSTFAHTAANLELPTKHPYLENMKVALKHLEKSDYEYFIKWCNLLQLEELETRSAIHTNAIWINNAQERQTQGRALIGLEIKSENIVQEKSRYLHTFQLQQNGSVALDQMVFDPLYITLYNIMNSFSCTWQSFYKYVGISRQGFQYSRTLFYIQFL